MTASLSKLELVVLAALARGKPPSEKELVKDVGTIALADQAPGAVRERLGVIVASLRERGLVEARRRAPTADGRRAVQEAFGLSRPPAWREVKLSHAPALALGCAPGSIDAQRALASASSLQAAVLCRQFGRPRAANVRTLCEQLLFERLGIPAVAVRDNRLLAHVLAHHAGVDAKPELDALAARLAANAVGARNGSKPVLIAALARRWATADDAGADTRRPQSSVSVPDELVTAVQDALPRVPPSGRFGDEKVFISSLWDAIDAKPPGMDLAQFKRWLVDANARQSVVLARADLVGAMDAAQVAASEIVDRGASFHFVLHHR